MDLLGAYALDALLPAEKAAVDAYLPSSPACQAELQILRQGVNAYALAAEERDPSPDLRNRLWTAIQSEPQAPAQASGRAVVQTPVSTLPAPTPIRTRTIPVWGRIAAALALMLAGAAIAWLALQDDNETGSVVVGQFALTDTADPSLTTGGDVEYLEDENIMRIDMHDLPELAEGEVYQLWVITGDVVAPSVVFTRDDEDTTSIAMIGDPSQVDALAITREPGPIGSVSATTPPFVIAPIDATEIDAG